MILIGRLVSALLDQRNRDYHTSRTLNCGSGAAPNRQQSQLDPHLHAQLLVSRAVSVSHRSSLYAHPRFSSYKQFSTYANNLTESQANLLKSLTLDCRRSADYLDPDLAKDIRGRLFESFRKFKERYNSQGDFSDKARKMPSLHIATFMELEAALR